MGVAPQPTSRKPSESGQAIILVIVALGTFIFGAIGFGVDFSNLYFHLQRAQSAADAACQAAGMDLLTIQEGTNTATSAGFTPGTGFDCASTSGAAPCKYAALNGYSGSGLSAGTESSKVTVSFPSTVSGATAPPVSVGGSYPFIEVDVIDRVRVFFSSLFTLSRTQDVKAVAMCGLQQDTSPIPILVLDPHPADTYTFQVQGTPTVAIYGGPSRSIQDDTPNALAIHLGGNGTVNLSKGGPNNNGSIMGVTGGPYSLTSLLSGSTTFTPDSSAYYAPSDDPISDPFAQMAAPTNTGMTTYTQTMPTSTITYHTNGCPDQSGCVEYQPGYYPNGIDVKNATAIFDPGVYYIEKGFAMDANSILRPAIIGGSASGSMFYLAGTGGSMSVASNSGTKTLNIDAFSTSYVTCPGGTAQTVTDTSGNTVTSLNGNILLGMCTGTYGDPLGQNRGMLFFEDRSATLSNHNQPSFGGGGTLLLAGNLYFHDCNSSGTGALPCTNTGAYSDSLTLGGNSGSGTYVLGDIVTDQLTLGGTSGISMQLNPTSAYNILKVELLQ